MKLWSRTGRLLDGWTAGRIATLLGFIFTIIGTLGAALVIEPASQRRDKLDADIVSAQNTVRLLRLAGAQVDAFVQLGSLVFSIRIDDKAPDEAIDAIAELKQRSLNQRHEGARNFIAQLAIAGEVDFKSTSQRYEALVETERKDFTLENYTATNTFEHELALKAVIDRGELVKKIAAMQYERAQVQHEYEQRSRLLLVITVIGSTLILAATLLAARQKSASPEQTPASTATRLIRLAIAEARKRIAQEKTMQKPAIAEELA